MVEWISEIDNVEYEICDKDEINHESFKFKLIDKEDILDKRWFMFKATSEE